MSFASRKEDTENTLVIAINLAADICDRLELASHALSGKASLLRCPSYISAARRPFFAASIIAAPRTIAFIDFDRSPDQAIEGAQYLTQAFPGKVTVVALTRSRDPGNIVNAMRAGCSEFLNLPVQPAALAELFERLEKKRLSTHSGQPHAGSVITFFGAKGGVGTTTMATHFALYLAQVHKKRTLLIDNHPELGHVAIYLGLGGGQHLFQDVVRNVDRLDSELLQGFLAEHSSGLHVLASLDTSDELLTAEEDALAKTVEFLRGEFEYIVVDCDIRLDSQNAPFIAASQHIYLVATPEVSAIRNLSRYVDRLALRDPSLDKVDLVLNRVSDSDAIQADEVEKSTRLPIAVRIPSDGREFCRACNLGEPLVPSRKLAVTAKLSEWTARLCGVPPVAAEDAAQKRFRPFRRTASQAFLGKKGLA